MSKIILITGATAGIGRATAVHLARQGHHVIATGRKPAELAQVKQEAGATKLDTVMLDVTSLASIAAAATEVDKLTADHGLDVLVNNAGFGVLGPTRVRKRRGLVSSWSPRVLGAGEVCTMMSRRPRCARRWRNGIAESHNAGTTAEPGRARKMPRHFSRITL